MRLPHDIFEKECGTVGFHHPVGDLGDLKGRTDRRLDTLEFTLRLNGARAATQSAQLWIQSELQALGCEAQVLSDQAALLHWSSVRDQEHPYFMPPPSQEASLWRVSLPLKALKLQAPSFAQRSMVEWFGALHWVWAKPSELSSLQEEVALLGGTMVLWRASAGEPIERLKAFNSPIEPQLLQLQRQLQKAFDPHGVFNTGRAYP
jgi:glycolate oxidase FAD binding subunit